MADWSKNKRFSAETYFYLEVTRNSNDKLKLTIKSNNEKPVKNSRIVRLTYSDLNLIASNHKSVVDVSVGASEVWNSLVG